MVRFTFALLLVKIGEWLIRTGINITGNGYVKVELRYEPGKRYNAPI